MIKNKLFHVPFSTFLFSGVGWFQDKAGFQCEECFKVFTNRNAYTNHLPSHQGKTTCNHCGKLFSSPSNLNKHIRKNQCQFPNPDVYLWSKLSFAEIKMIRCVHFHSWVQLSPNSLLLQANTTTLGGAMVAQVVELARMSVLSVAKPLRSPPAWPTTWRPTQASHPAPCVEKSCQESATCRGTCKLYTRNSSSHTLKSVNTRWENIQFTFVFL